MKKLLLILALSCFPALAHAQGGTCTGTVPSGISSCYYLDYASGVDTNNGTSESTPWKHAPGMKGVTGVPAGVTPAAGEGFILKGGVTWPAAALQWYWTWSGTSTGSSPGCTGSGCIYIGVDQTWYTGGSWARPILNAGGAALSGTNTLFGCYCNYLVVDNIEFTGLYWSGSPAYGTGNNIALAGGSPGIGMDDTFEHLYIHGWSHGTFASGTTENPCGITGDTGDPNNNANTILEYSVFDGSDTDEASCNGAVFGSPPFIEYNEFKYVTSCMVIDSPVSVHDNTCENIPVTFDTTPAHQNGVEENFSQATTLYNNLFRHIANGALTVWLAPDFGYTAYAFANVLYDTATGNVFDIAASIKTTPSGAVIAWNNSLECGPDSNPNAVCFAGISSEITAVTLQNNHVITNQYGGTNNGLWSTNGVTPTTTTNLEMSQSTATSDGYTSSQTNAFSPTSSGSPTKGAGTSASTFCTSSGVGTPCGQSTTYGVAYNATNHTVSTPALAPANLNSPPDIGAYQYPLSGGSSFTLTASTAGTGSGTIGSCPTGSYTGGNSVSCSATASGGSTFVGWSGTCGLTGSTTPTSFTMPSSNCTVIATFNLTGSSDSALGVSMTGVTVH